ncbi:MAG TPA: hypothetical protein VFR85_13665 [Anaeromyxobacteraceae bacterium]|nr:hypothetical protein [Anaeromyxobacteraceae bacterium]
MSPEARPTARRGRCHGAVTAGRRAGGHAAAPVLLAKDLDESLYASGFDRFIEATSGLLR